MCATDRAALLRIDELLRDELKPDPVKTCMICRERPRQIAVTGGGQICRCCARNVPIDMLGGEL